MALSTEHKSIEFPFADSVRESVLAAAESVLSSLEAYRKARRGERTDLQVPADEIRPVDAASGTLLLRWREEVDLACRMERAGEGLSATVSYRIEGDRLFLTMLDEKVVEERVDEI